MNLDCCDFFKAVSDPNRVKMLLILAKGELTVSGLGKHFKMTQPSISHHLGILKAAKIVESRKEGKEVYYKLIDSCITDSCSKFMRQFAGKTG